jgi:hypothetical protein
MGQDDPRSRGLDELDQPLVAGSRLDDGFVLSQAGEVRENRLLVVTAESLPLDHLPIAAD